jgi:hypothetical protein
VNTDGLSVIFPKNRIEEIRKNTPDDQNYVEKLEHTAFLDAAGLDKPI